MSPHADRVPLQVLFHDDVQDGESDGARHRVTAKLRDLDQRRGTGEGGVGAGGGGSGLTVLKYSIPDEAKA